MGSSKEELTDIRSKLEYKNLSMYFNEQRCVSYQAPECDKNNKKYK